MADPTRARGIASGFASKARFSNIVGTVMGLTLNFDVSFIHSAVDCVGRVHFPMTGYSGAIEFSVGECIA